jgi:hypothetical protein
MEREMTEQILTILGVMLAFGGPLTAMYFWRL